MAIKLVTKQKWDGEGRAFGSTDEPYRYIVTLLSDNGEVPEGYEDVDGLDKCAFAPGSILIDTANKVAKFYTGSEWSEWA